MRRRIFPARRTSAEAQRVSSKAGQEISGMNFSLIVTRLARVSGRAAQLARRARRARECDAGADRVGGRHDDAGRQRHGFAGRLVPDPERRAGTLHAQSSPDGHGHADRRVCLAADYGRERRHRERHGLDAVGATVRGVVVTDTGEAPTFRPDQVQLFASTPGADDDAGRATRARPASTKTFRSR